MASGAGTSGMGTSGMIGRFGIFICAPCFLGIVEMNQQLVEAESQRQGETALAL